MTAVLVIESVVLVLLALLVAGLLRSHASILRRLHALDGGDESAPAVRQALPDPSFRSMPGMAEPVPLDQPFAAAMPITGRTVDGDTVVIRTADVEHRTVLAFLSSTCATCEAFWSAFAARDLRLPPRTRVVIIAKDAAEESPAALAGKQPAGIDVVMSSAAWADYRVPGSPYVIAVDGQSGTVVGEGTGMSWEQVAKLLAEATGDAGFVTDISARNRKPTSDAERETRVDAELMAAGILPGDVSLYPEPQAAPLPPTNRS